MFRLRQIFLSVNLASILLCYSSMGHALTTANIQNRNHFYGSTSTEFLKQSFSNKSFFYIGLLYLQPSSDNLKYATFVSGTQPYYQSWHYQEIKPHYHPAFELGLNYAIPCTSYSAGIDWTHLDSNDTSSKQASRNTDLSTVEFVAPPYEMSPPVFGIKRADSKVNFDFDGVLLDVAKVVEFNPQLSARFFGGIDILKLNQTITTTFSDYAGSPPTPYSYPLPPDPSFSFQTENVSKYLGAGPALGMGIHYKTNAGFGFLGEFLGLLTAGTSKTVDNFTSTSTRLKNIGIGTSHQQITSPNDTQLVFGADGKLGVFYTYCGTFIQELTIEAGYRMATYLNAISTITPNTLVQPGTVITTPEFATGTMAIVSTKNRSSPFNFNGPFLNVNIAIS